MRHALIAAIRAYQRHLSPRKGYGCAYRLVHGGSGCSGVGLRLVRRYGVWQGVWLLRQRLRRCQQAQRQRTARLHFQSGHCDTGCCECAQICGAGDFPLPQRLEEWLEENKILVVCLVLLAMFLGLFIS